MPDAVNAFIRPTNRANSRYLAENVGLISVQRMRVIFVWSSVFFAILLRCRDETSSRSAGVQLVTICAAFELQISVLHNRQPAQGFSTATLRRHIHRHIYPSHQSVRGFCSATLLRLTLWF